MTPQILLKMAILCLVVVWAWPLIRFLFWRRMLLVACKVYKCCGIDVELNTPMYRLTLDAQANVYKALTMAVRGKVPGCDCAESHVNSETRRIHFTPKKDAEEKKDDAM